MVALLYSTNNHVQMRLETMKNQLEAIQQKLEDSLQLFVSKRGRAYSKGEKVQRKVCIVIGGVHILLFLSYLFILQVYIMGLIHYGFGVCLFLTYNSWMVFETWFTLYILLMLFILKCVVCTHVAYVSFQGLCPLSIGFMVCTMLYAAFMFC